ncbi:MAG: hypothetical protein O7H41_09050 [Planctomycetota bacterium]|nr:hypothetical protein [Planctomycetota bacterium]
MTRKMMRVLRKPVGALPTILVMAALVIVIFLAKPPMRVLVISVVGGIVISLLACANQLHKSKSKSTDEWTCPPYSLN